MAKQFIGIPIKDTKNIRDRRLKCSLQGAFSLRKKIRQLHE